MQTHRCTDKHLKNCQREIQPLLPQELYIQVRTLNSAVVTYQVRTSTTLLRSALTRVCKNKNNEYEYHDRAQLVRENYLAPNARCIMLLLYSST